MIDLYTLLEMYASKHETAVVDEKKFLSFYLKQETGKAMSRKEKKTQYQLELENLIIKGRCRTLIDDDERNLLFLPEVCNRQMVQYYSNISEIKSRPYPNEDNLGIKIPKQYITDLDMDKDLTFYIDEPDDQKNIVTRIIFPDDIGTMLILTDMIPKVLIESALYKISNYLSNRSNKEYVFQKLLPQFKAKETYLQNMLDQIQSKTLQCYDDIAEGNEAAFVFWAFFCTMIKRAVKEKKTLTTNDIDIAEAVFIVDAIIHYYKSIMLKSAVKEQAFKDLEDRLTKPPYLYTFNSIMNFTTVAGEPILTVVSHAEFDAWFQKMTFESVDNRLPKLIMLRLPNKEEYFVSKNKILTLCDRLIMETKDSLKAAIYQRWNRLLREFLKEEAMEKDGDFEKLLQRYLVKVNQFLAHLLQDPRLRLSYFDIFDNQENASIATKLFTNGELNPCSMIFGINRKNVYNDVRDSLPLRYTIPVISAIYAFFKKLTRRNTDSFTDEYIDTGVTLREGSREQALRELERSMVPKDYTLESYLEEVEGRWMQLTDKSNQDIIRNDVNALVRDTLRKTLGEHRRRILTREEIFETASLIVQTRPSLRALKGRESLVKYIELYILRLLKTGGF